MAEGSIWANATVSALAGAVGGGVISFVIAAYAETRNRYFVHADAVRSALEEVSVDACSYWQTSGSIPAVEAKIKAGLERVDLRLQGLKGFRKIRKKYKSLESALDILSDVSTGGQFEEVRRTRNSVRSDRIREISKEIVGLIQ